jgi:CRISPR-associated protein Cas6
MNRIGPEMVDVAFGMTAAALPADYEWALYREVARVAPWIRDFPGAGIHPVRAARGPAGELLLPQRAKLVVRMPRERLCAASALEGALLDLAGVPVRLARARLRRLAPAPTLYAARVVTGDDEEGAFSAVIARELAALGVPRTFMCGRRAVVRLERGMAAAFSVAVHGLPEADSLRLLDTGLGRERAIGCGLLVPHKTITTAQ